MGKGRGPRKSPGLSPPRPHQPLADALLAPQPQGVALLTPRVSKPAPGPHRERPRPASRCCGPVVPRGAAPGPRGNFACAAPRGAESAPVLPRPERYLPRSAALRPRQLCEALGARRSPGGGAQSLRQVLLRVPHKHIDPEPAPRGCAPAFRLRVPETLRARRTLGTVRG